MLYKPFAPNRIAATFENAIQCQQLELTLVASLCSVADQIYEMLEPLCTKSTLVN